jgi:hypothetical protein
MRTSRKVGQDRRRHFLDGPGEPPRLGFVYAGIEIIATGADPRSSMTLDVYADLFDDDLDAVAISLDAAIKSTADPLRTISTQ